MMMIYNYLRVLKEDYNKMASAIKRIIHKDMKELQKMNLESLGIFIEFEEENIMKAKAIIIGPKKTPFENGILYFIIEFLLKTQIP